MFNYCFFTVKHKMIRFALVYPTGWDAKELGIGYKYVPETLKA